MKSKLKAFKLAFVLLLFLDSSCNNKNEETASNSNITKVTVALSGMGCEGKCPSEIVRISKNLNIEYFGGDFAKRKGYYIGKIPKEIWDSVQTKFNKFLTVGVDSTGMKKTDHPETEFIIYEGQRENRVKVNTGSLSERDLKTLYWFTRKVVENTILKPTDSIDFGLTPISPPPFPASKIQ